MGTPCRASRSVLEEASRRWPGRSTASDGLCASAAHSAQNPTSDHEPDSRGICHATDLTKDVGAGCDVHALWNGLAARRDPRVKYLIRDRQIWNPSVALYWRAYFGSNPHEKHGHVSILTALEDDVAEWFGDSGGDLMAGEADRIIATIGSYEQDTRKLLLEVLERMGAAARKIAAQARQVEGRRTRRILEAIAAQSSGKALDVEKVLADDEELEELETPEEVAARYLAEIEELGADLDRAIDEADGRGELVTREDVDRLVAAHRAELARLAGQ